MALRVSSAASGALMSYLRRSPKLSQCAQNNPKITIMISSYLYVYVMMHFGWTRYTQMCRVQVRLLHLGHPIHATRTIAIGNYIALAA